MSMTITVRGVDAQDKSWLKFEAGRLGISMEEYLRRLIRERRQQAEQPAKPSEIFRQYFGPEHGVDLPERGEYGYRPVDLTQP